MALQDLIQKIVISGADDVSSAFDGIGKAGEDAFKKIADAAKGTPFAELAEGLAGVVAAVAAVSAATFAWAESASNAVFEMGHLADQAGTTIEEMSGLKIALGTLGVDTDGLGLSFKRLAVNIQKNWEEISKDVRDGATKIQEDMSRINAANIAYADAAEKLAQHSKNAAQQQRQDANSVEGATLSLESAEQRLQTLRGNPPSSAQRQALQLKEAELAVTKAQEAADDAVKKKRDDAAKAIIDRWKEVQAVEKARLDAIAATNKLYDDQLKDIGKIAEVINGTLVKGLDLAKVSAANMVKGIEAAASVDGLPPTVLQTFLKASDVFKGLTDNTQKMAIAVQLFGRGVSQELIAAMSQGSAGIEKLKQAAIDAGLAFSDADEKIAGPFHQALAELGNVASATSSKLGLLFAPSFTATMQEITTWLKSNQKEILAWGNYWKDAIINTVSEIGKLISDLGKLASNIVEAFGGNALSSSDKFRLAVGAIGTAVLLLIAAFAPILFWPIVIGLVIVAAAKLWAALGGMDGVKKAWQTFSDWVMSTWVGSIISGIQNILNWLDKLANKFGGMGQVAKIMFGGNATGAAGHADGGPVGYASGGFVGKFKGIPKFAGGGSSGNGGSDNFDPVTAVNALGQAIQKLVDATVQGMQAGKTFDLHAFGGGGGVRGAGTATSDSILAYLSDGEFVMRAAAVSKYGLSFMHMINQGLIDGFAMGGLAGSPVRLASGGAVPASHTVNLRIDGQTFGMKASADTAASLQRFAIGRQMSTTGRKPSWVR